MQIPPTNAASPLSPLTRRPSQTDASGFWAPPLTASAPGSAEQDFMAYAKMTPAQKMRAEILGSMKLTENDLKAMPAKQRQEIEDKIKHIIQQKVAQDAEKKKGVVVDIKA